MAFALQHSHNDNFGFSVIAAFDSSALFDVLVHVAGFAADEGFVNFYFFAVSTEFHKRLGLDSKPDAMEHEPCSLLSDSQSAVNLVRADAVLAANQQPDSGKPLLKGNRGVLKYGSNLQREFLLCMVAVAAIYAGLCQIGNFVRVTIRTADFAVRPANGNHEFAAVVVIAEMLDGLLQGLDVFHSKTRVAGNQ